MIQTTKLGAVTVKSAGNPTTIADIDQKWDGDYDYISITQPCNLFYQSHSNDKYFTQARCMKCPAKGHNRVK